MCLLKATNILLAHKKPQHFIFACLPKKIQIGDTLSDPSQMKELIYKLLNLYIL